MDPADRRGAFPEDTAPCYLLRDGDGVYGDGFSKRMTGLGIEEVRTAPYSPSQNPFAERLVGSIRRDCLDHVIVPGEAHLRAILKSHFAYYHRARTHLSLGKDAPDTRPVQHAAGRGRLHPRRSAGVGSGEAQAYWGAWSSPC